MQNQQNYNNSQPPKVQKVMNATIATGEYFSQKEQKNKKSYLTNGGMSLKLG